MTAPYIIIIICSPGLNRRERERERERERGGGTDRQRRDRHRQTNRERERVWFDNVGTRKQFEWLHGKKRLLFAFHFRSSLKGEN